MGLDMYLSGRKFFWTNFEHPELIRKEDGFEVEEVKLRLGYWRKHPNLHGYIVEKFAKGIDTCQEIELQRFDIEQIIKAIENDELPVTGGFFFGQSFNTPDDKSQAIELFKKAIEWLDAKHPRKDTKVSKSVVYQASW